MGALSRGARNRQVIWGGIAGIVTVGLMLASYTTGFRNGQDAKEAVVVERNSEELCILVQSNCEEYQSGVSDENEQSVVQYCVQYSAGSAFDMMSTLAEQDDSFVFDYDKSEFGIFVTSINNYHPDEEGKFWAFYVNGEISMVGVGDYRVVEGDELKFKVEDMNF